MLSISQNDVVKVGSDTSNTNIIVFISSKGNVIRRSIVQATPGSPRSTVRQSIDGTFSGTRLKIIVHIPDHCGIKVERNSSSSSGIPIGNRIVHSIDHKS